MIPPTEAVASYQHDGQTYEIDHLGIALDSTCQCAGGQEVAGAGPTVQEWGSAC